MLYKKPQMLRPCPTMSNVKVLRIPSEMLKVNYRQLYNAEIHFIGFGLYAAYMLIVVLTTASLEDN